MIRDWMARHAPPASPGARNGVMAEKRSALVVATSEYEDARLAPLGGPGRDAEALETVLGDAEIGGFDVQLALNSPLAELRTTLDSFFADRTRDELLLVHFSGHGLKDDDGQLYLAAADTRIDRLHVDGDRGELGQQADDALPLREDRPVP